jgi:hypothetical protein
LFGRLDPETYWGMVFALKWTPAHCGGLHLSLDEIDSMPLGRLAWFLEQINDRREAEHEAAEKAARTPSKPQR